MRLDRVPLGFHPLERSHRRARRHVRVDVRVDGSGRLSVELWGSLVDASGMCARDDDDDKDDDGKDNNDNDNPSRGIGKGEMERGT